MEMARKVVQRVMDLEELVEYGQGKMMCPFYYSRKVKESMDVVFMPYNYVLDQNIASKMWEVM